MNLLTLIFRSIPLIAVGVYLVYEATKEPNEDFIFDGVWMLGKAIIAIIVLIWTFNNNRKEFAETKSGLSFLPIVTGITCSIIFYLFQAKENPSILFAGHDGGYNGASIDLKADGTYKFSNSSGLGSTYTYGHYKLKDSIITLDKSIIDKVIESNKLVIRPNTNTFHPENDTLIYQLDENGRTKGTAIIFTVHKDRRNK